MLRSFVPSRCWWARERPWSWRAAATRLSFVPFSKAISVPGRSKVALGTVWPRGTVFHVPASRTVVAALAAVCEHCAYPEICDHLHVYDNDSVLLQWYDAFSQPLWVSKRVSGGAMEAFCGELRVTFREIDSP